VDGRRKGVAGLVSQRLIFVTGKGGVGKSTVAAALAIASANSGMRTLIAEISGQHYVQSTFAPEEHPAREVEVAPGLFTVSIDPQLAMEEYLRIRLGRLWRALGSAKLFQALMTATPGMREMQTMAKIWELAHPDRPAGAGVAYDVVVVDAPATGHAIGMLRTPRTFMELARIGPVANGARLIAAMIADPAFTGFVAVTTAEQMAVTETLSLRDALRRDGLKLSTVVLNRLYPDRFTPSEAEKVQNVIADAPDAVKSAARAAVFEHQRARLQRAQVARIAGQVTVPLVTLPFLFGDGAGQCAHNLAGALAEAWPGPVAQAGR